MSITLLDGGMGQELIRRSTVAPTALWSTQVMIDQPDLVRGIHADFFAAGAEIATANTYAIHRDRLVRVDREDDLTVLHETACRIAVEARDAHGSGRVAGSIGPLGASYRTDITPPLREAIPLMEEVARVQMPFVDLFLIETMSSLQQARAALRATLPLGTPVWIGISVSDEDGTRLRSGEPVEDVLDLIGDLTPEALLVNCAIPEAVTQALGQLEGCPVSLGAYANGFTRISEGFLTDAPTVDALTCRTDVGPQAYAAHVADWVSLGASIVGGCCEVGPDHISELHRRFVTHG